LNALAGPATYANFGFQLPAIHKWLQLARTCQNPNPKAADRSPVPPSLPMVQTSHMAIETSAELPTLFKSARAFEVWLKQHHAASPGLWLKLAKRGAPDASVTYPEAVEIALCWGWIDGQKKALDAHYFLQRFTPRRARSVWSKVNVAKVESLIQQGRMQAPGLAQVETAKADGRWARAYDGARTTVVPDDLLAALDAAPMAKVFFAQISASNRYAVLWRIQTAAKAETRARRIAQLVQMLARGETIHAASPRTQPVGTPKAQKIATQQKKSL